MCFKHVKALWKRYPDILQQLDSPSCAGGGYFHLRSSKRHTRSRSPLRYWVTDAPQDCDIPWPCLELGQSPFSILYKEAEKLSKWGSMDTIGCTCLSCLFTALMSWKWLDFFVPRIEQTDMPDIALRKEQVRADIPEQNYGGNVQIYCMLPKAGPKKSTKHVGKHWKQILYKFLKAIGKKDWKDCNLHQFVFAKCLQSVCNVLSCFVMFCIGFLFCHDFVSFGFTLKVSGNLATVFIVSSRSSPCHVTWDLCFCFHRAIKHCGPVGRVRRVKGERHQLVSEF